MLAQQDLKFWMRAARPQSFGQSGMPYVMGALLGLSVLLYSGTATPLTIGIALLMGVLGMAGIIFAHAGMNLFDDYFDMKKGAVEQRDELIDGGFRARLGKCGYLKDGSVTLADTKRVASLFVIVALIIGAVIFAVRGWEVLIFAGITLVLGFSYAGPPLRLSYRGFGELVIGIIFGPVLVIAAAFVVSGQITMLAIFSSIPIGLLVANIVHMHAVMDFGPDKAAQRKTLPILLGSERAGVMANVVFVVLAQAIVLAGVVLGYLPVVALLAVLTYPLTIVFIQWALSYAHSKGQDETPFQPQKWMGQFGDWEGYRKAGLDWFMARWLLARNLVAQMTLVLVIAAFTPWYVPWGQIIPWI